MRHLSIYAYHAIYRFIERSNIAYLKGDQRWLFDRQVHLAPIGHTATFRSRDILSGGLAPCLIFFRSSELLQAVFISLRVFCGRVVAGP